MTLLTVLLLGIMAQTPLQKATFAGGCFWCLEGPFETHEGVVDVATGYTGGAKPNPAYEEVSTGTTGHYEAIQITYDPSRVTYAELLDIFWRQIDPTDAGGQFVDRGSQYRSAIFYHNAAQKKMTEESIKALALSGRYRKPIVTELLPVQQFYTAENYHQDYYQKNPLRYKMYRSHSGRDDYLQKTWVEEGGQCKAISKDNLKQCLSPLQYEVTQQCSTEPPFNNAYWNNKREGIYVDLVSGEPLFSSKDKFDSGTGWPSFTKPLDPNNIIEQNDTSAGMKRIEVKSKKGRSHLGHLFDDGPKPIGLRYCINSASLRFIPKEDLEKEGYGKYKKLFETGQKSKGF